MNEPICECGHNIDCHYSAGCLRYEDDIDADQCKCPQFTDTRIGTLRAQLAAIRPAFEKLKAYVLLEETRHAQSFHCHGCIIFTENGEPVYCRDHSVLGVTSEQRREALALAEKVEVKG